MEGNRVRIADIAEELGLSTATVSNVIHGKTNKVSVETVHRVQELLERRQYIPSMAGILLAQNNSRIIGVVVNDHEKYEGHVLEDGFISASLNALSAEIDRAGYFMMLKTTWDWNEISRFASMWNMEGLVIMGFCGQDYKRLREQMRIPFVAFDGMLNEPAKLGNIAIDDFQGGVTAGEYLRSMGHRSVLCIADNDIHGDRERYRGLRNVLPEAEQMLIPMETEQRWSFYRAQMTRLRKYTAVFAVSDYYALDFISFWTSQGGRVPDDMSVMGFDDSPLGRMSQPALTTIRQDYELRAKTALAMLQDLREGGGDGREVRLPVKLVVRNSVARYNG
ncbi:MAG: LacI family transcriptional regulator [Lachnospiraceae bacterium]|nr:LacI family transcriptional regulator [Lachnospiraceae bacterium]